MEPKSKPVIGITIGDLAGIGPEIIHQTLSDPRILQLCIPVIYGAAAQFEKPLSTADGELEPLPLTFIQQASSAIPKKLNAVRCWNEEWTITPGKPTQDSGAGALRSILKAADDLEAGHLDAIVTAPIDKHNIQAEKFSFPGHTEFFTDRFKATESLMLLVAEQLRVATVTGHISIKEIPAKLTQDLIRHKLNVLLNSLQQDFGIKKPRVAVLGLNPHAGENGLLGKEEKELIEPLLRHQRDQGKLVFGPYSADGFFATGAYKQFDATLAMYHDQGLIPFKTLAFHNGVNFTAGLSIIRTSPDHGTAYDLAGTGKASPESFRSALFAALDIYRNRFAHLNPRD
jgi:4-hydroxythreonine-4-phosphate dehydrogenase